MNESVKMITVDGTNVDDCGFFCYKSKPKSEGYQNKLNWLRQPMAEGLTIKMVYEGSRSVGFIEYIPGEHSWRVVEAPHYLVIHCLWVVGRAKKKGYGACLLNACVEDAHRLGKTGVAMVSSRGNWLANEKVFLKNGFEVLDSAPPSFRLLVKKIKEGSDPQFPQDWDKRLSRYGSGIHILHTDQCPYIPNMVQHAVDFFMARGYKAKVVRFTNSAEVRAKSPSAYGVFAIVCDGRLLTYHFIGKKELRRFEEEFMPQI